MLLDKSPKTLYWLITLTFLLYLPGSTGPFLYDDFVNLNSLSGTFTENIANLTTILTSGVSSELGRPVALFSFAVQPGSFPDSAFLYKLINILLHLFNGYLLFHLSKQLFARFKPEQEHLAEMFALYTTALWILHPLFFSTTLYVIQRMTQLSFMFSFLALNYFIKLSFNELNTLKSIFKPGLIIGVFILLGILSKENSVMIFPVLLFLTFALTDAVEHRFIRRFAIVASLVPMLLLIWKIWPYTTNEYFNILGYDYGSIDRIQTQVVVLIYYLGQIVTANIDTMSLHHDNFPMVQSISDSRFIFAVGIHLTIIVLAVASKQKIIQFAVVWFYIWHLLESSALPLILYFEHRNYIPSVGIIWVVALLATELASRVDSKGLLKNSLLAIPLLYLVVNSTLLSFIWADHAKLLQHWSLVNPASERTALAKYNFLISGNQLSDADRHLTELPKQLKESSLALSLVELSLKCALEKDPSEAMTRATQLSMQRSAIHPIILDVHSSSMPTLINNKDKCPQSLMQMQSITDNILATAPQRERKSFASQLLTNQAFLALNLGQANEALVYFEKAYDTGRKVHLIPLIDLNMQLQNVDKARYWFKAALKYETNRNQQQPSIASNLTVLRERYREQLQ